MDTIRLEDFQRVEMRVGTVLSASLNEKARKPAWVMEIDFGPELGTRHSSAQLTELYDRDDLVGTQIVAVMNFPPLRIAGVKSEVLVLGILDSQGVVLLRPERGVGNGIRIA
ncbi:MAG: tRNA-binding protein [Gammaproteobacteria bacterium]|nr:tRNA-binding protein [Gammaproteobacteria bacterium]MYD75754.1 tRNA-binding protein [Gammaproteobacteria bacterium]MYJ51223.1 tRNA-binding protein [Gammaproteobacteria bacterium]